MPFSSQIDPARVEGKAAKCMTVAGRWQDERKAEASTKYGATFHTLIL